MYFDNTKAKGEFTHEGSVADVFKRMRNIIETNDGTRSFEWVTDSCHDQQAPFDHNKETRIALTSTQHLISDISKGFFTLKVIAKDVQVTGITAGSFNDPKHLIKGFLGWRDSNEAIRQIQIWVNGHSIGYNQQEGIREGFAYSTCKDADEMTTAFIHSVYEKVVNYATTKCGEYFNFNDFKDGLAHTIEWTANIPFDDLLVLQAFELFPNFAIPNVEVRLYIDPAGLVWCPVSPYAVYEHKTLIQGESIPYELPQGINYTRQFIQINEYGTAPITFTENSSGEAPNITFTAPTITSGEIKVSCNNLSITELSSHMCGFGVCQQSLSEIMDVLKDGINIPTQFLTYDSFPDAAKERGLKSTVRATLSNATNISIVFPKHANDITVMENPMYENLQLRIDNKPFPDKTLSTIGAEFLQMQLIASDLDGPIRWTQEFEDSYTQPKNAEDGTRYANTLRDSTRFMWNLQLERNGCGYFFDGYESFGRNIPIEIEGKPIYQGANDTYYNVDAAGTVHPPPVQLWTCRDCYIQLVPGDMCFHVNGEPSGTQKDLRMRPPEH